MRKIIIALIYLSPFLLSCNAQKNSSVVAEINPFKYTSSKKVIAENGAVVSADPLASKVGVVILKMGGNAVDAAIATQLALAVVYPAAGNIGGGGFLVGRLSNGELISIDYREKAPGSASRDMYIDETGKARTDLSQNGHLAGGVPGTVSGLFTSHQYAKLPFSKLIQPAIDLAEKGFAITSGEARAFNSIQESLKKYNSVMPAFVKQTPWKEGDTLIQTDLANTLKS